MPAANVDFSTTMAKAKRSRMVHFAALAAATALVLVGAFVGGRSLLSGSGDPVSPIGGDPTESTTPTPTETPTPTVSPTATSKAGVTCSASSLASEPDEQQGLPAAVAETRRRIVELATACDYETLGELARAGDPRFNFSFGAGPDDEPGAYWKKLEATDEPFSDVMSILVQTLDLSHCVEEYVSADAVVYQWPAANCLKADDADWAELVPLYDADLVEQMKQGGSGFLGYRVVITEDGDWISFIGGD